MVILYILLVLIAVILARTLMFTPRQSEAKEHPPVEQDTDASIRNLAELVKCKTVSYYDASLENDLEFEKLILKLPELYPNVFQTCTLQRFDGRGLLFRWQGKSEGAPAVLMAHYDVVPVEEAHWSRPAFEAIIEDGVMWGRGTLDTKATFNGILSGAENLIRQGFR
ncbi:MAG: M20/M25/M40 family metallo-hydrolase, partial [Eubacteriales bacterium]|nr:M20/M25/M40 family metallo-hydrolase [Eubacteriales bacterium]